MLVVSGPTLLAVALVGLWGPGQRGRETVVHELVVIAPGSGTRILAAKADPGDVLDLSYTHSVSNSRVTGRFRITDDGGLEPVHTTFRSFGPGLPWSSGEHLERLDDGTMIVHHDEPARDELRIWVSPLTEDTICFGEHAVHVSRQASEPFLIVISVRSR